MFISGGMAYDFQVQYQDDPGFDPQEEHTNRSAEAMKFFLELQQNPDVEWIAIFEHNRTVCEANNTDDPVRIKFWKRG